MLIFLLAGAQAFLLLQKELFRHSSERVNTTLCAINGTAEGPIIADGFSRVSCIQDGSPKDVRLYYKDTIVKTSQQNMDPKTCFNFCRDKTGSRFFLIEHGRDCYCTEYFHDISTGGGGCDLPCEADTSEMCGGKVKASAFEMHMCGKSADRADAAAASARAEGGKALMTSKIGDFNYAAFEALSTHWQLGVCSKSAQVCDLAVYFEDKAQEIRDASVRAKLAGEAANNASDAVEAAKAAGFETAEQAQTLESAISTSRDELANAATKAAMLNLALKRASGPVGDAPVVDGWESLFVTASSRDEWHAICDLTPSAKYVALRSDEPAACADVCISAGDSCVGFNVQYLQGALSCQMLSSEGVYSPDDSLADVFGVFEITETKVADLGFDRIDCFVKNALLLRNGGTKARKIADIITVGTTATSTTTSI